MPSSYRDLIVTRSSLEEELEQLQNLPEGVEADQNLLSMKQKHFDIIDNQIKAIDWDINNFDAAVAGGRDPAIVSYYTKEKQDIKKAVAERDERERVASNSFAKNLNEALNKSLDQFVGVLETGTTVTTGAITGSIGMTFGFLNGLARQAYNLATDNDTKVDIEKFAEQGFRAGTYTPRTEDGKYFAEVLGKTLQFLEAVPPTMYPVRNIPLALSQSKAGKTLTSVADDLGLTEVDTRKLEGVSEIDPLKIAQEYATGKRNESEWVALAMQTDPRIVKSAQELGIIDYLHADHVTTNQQFRELAQITKSIMGSEVGAQEKANLTKVKDRVEEIAKTIGAVDDLSIPRTSVKNQLESNLNDVLTQANTYYDVVSEAVPRSTRLTARDSFIKFYNEEVEAMGSEKLLKTLQPELARINAVLNNPDLTYGGIDALRKSINQGISNKTGVFKDISTTNSLIYSNILSEVQANQAYAISQVAGDAFKTAQNLSRTGFAIKDDLSALFGKNLDADNITTNLMSGISSIPKGQFSKLNKVIDAVPENLRSEVILSGLLASVRKAGKQNNPISFGNYVALYESVLKNKDARSLFIGNLEPSQRKAMADIYRVSKSIKNSLDAKTTTGRVMSGLRDKAPESIIRTILMATPRLASKAANKAPIGTSSVAELIARTADGGSKNVSEFVDNVLASGEFNTLIKAVGTPQQEAAIREFANMGYFRKAYKGELDIENLTRKAIFTANAETEGDPFVEDKQEQKEEEE